MTLAAKLAPPAIPPPVVKRPRLEVRLDDVLERRLAVVVAGPGFGKSTLLGGWVERVGGAWYSITEQDVELAAFARGLVRGLGRRLGDLPGDLWRPEDGAPEREAADAIALRLCDALEQRLDRDLALVLDDLHELGTGGAIRLVESLVRQAPGRLHVVLASRTELPFSVERLRGQGHFVELSSAELAFTADEIAGMVATALEREDAGLVEALRQLTGGWPAAVRLVLETLRPLPPAEREVAFARMHRPGGPLFSYLAREVFGREPPEVVRLIRTVAPLDRFSTELCEALDLPAAGATIDGLIRRGLFVQARTDGDWYTLHALVREFAAAAQPLQPEELREIHLRAAVWLESAGHREAALGSFVAAGDAPSLARFLHDEGEALLAAGVVQPLILAAAELPLELRDPRVEKIVGDAHLARGEMELAAPCFERAAQGAETIPPGLAWSMGLLHYPGGDLREALRIYARGRIDGANSVDEAALLAYTSNAYYMLENTERCRDYAERALEAATAAGDQVALAHAQHALGMSATLLGEPAEAEAHYGRALEAAQAAPEIWQILRTRNNLACVLLEEGRYLDALEQLDAALALWVREAPLCTRGDVFFHLGRLEEALADYRSALGLFRRRRSNYASSAVNGLGNVYRERGDLALARAAYEEAVALAERGNIVEQLRPALAGLARVVVGEDPDAATRLAERAIELGQEPAAVALLAAGWVAHARGLRPLALERAEQSAAAARGRRQPEALAEALDLWALADDDVQVSRDRLEQSLSIRRQLGGPIAAAKVELALARLAGPAGQRAADRALRRLQRLGVRPTAAGAAGLLMALGPDRPPPLEIRTLGGFAVLRDGRPVGPSEWKSRKARDVLKLLVAHRGGPLAREALQERLWPDDDPVKTANRLSVALSTLRTVLDPDRGHPPGHLVQTVDDAVVLDLGKVVVDFHSFLSEAEAGLSLLRAGPTQEALELLEAAESLYGGDFLEEDAYEEWTVVAREQARSAYIAVARAMAEAASTAGDHNAASRYYLRVLERDPYDEAAHLGQVAALDARGSHGEARRAYGFYVSRMQDIGVEPASFPPPRRSA